MEEKSRINDIFLLLAITVAGTLLRCYNLALIGFWGDEIQATTFAEKPFREIFRLITQTEVSPPLDYFILHIAHLLGASSEFTYRIPALIFGAVAIIGIYFLGKELFGKKEGFISSILLSLAPLHILYSRDARMYSLFALLSILSSLFVLRALKTGKIFYWGCYSAVTVVSFYTHYFTLFIVISHIAYVITLSGLEKKLSHIRQLAISLAVSGILYLPWLRFLITQAPHRQEMIIPLTFAEILSNDFSTTFLWLGGGNITAATFIPVFFICGLFAFKREKNSVIFAIINSLLLVPLISFFIFKTRWVFQIRYVIFLLPPFLILCSRGMTFLSGMRVFNSQKMKISAVLNTFIAILILALWYPTMHDAIFLQKENWRDAASSVKKIYKPGDLLISVPYWGLWCLEKYGAMAEDGKITTPILGEHSLVFIRPYGDHPGKMWEDMCDGEMEIVSTFPGWNPINIWKGKLKYSFYAVKPSIKISGTSVDREKILLNNAGMIFISGREKTSDYRITPQLMARFFDANGKETGSSKELNAKALLTGDFTYWGWIRDFVDIPEGATTMELSFSMAGNDPADGYTEFKDLQVFLSAPR
ncbi:MAG: glycosyltransferase family 39 protein [Candidatus Schekmanbacteria bacterium]|nr:glycosyltransferase family 39 protein [Candidatus Schekmanbacteria bacterium]